MEKFVKDFSKAMVELNQTVNGHNNNNNQYQPGIGPYGEDQIVDMVMEYLSQKDNECYGTHFIRPKNGVKAELGLEDYRGITNRPATPDLVLQNKIIEFKIARPLRNNGQREDTWFKKVFEPNPKSYSTFVDVEKLHDFEGSLNNQNFEKWIVVIGFERLNENEYNLDQLFPGLFRYISEEIRHRKIKDFISNTEILGDRHPFHQVVKLYAFRY